MENTTSSWSNGTDVDDIPQYIGFICCGIASIMFGTNFVPVKKFETGDGMYFQWVLSNAIIMSAIVVQTIRLSRFYPFVMVGGILWATGNICVVPIVKTIGLGLGICVWGSAQLLVGWANGRFGLVGVEAEIPNNLAMNYAGVSISLVSTVMYAFVKPDIKPITMDITIPAPDAESANSKSPKVVELTDMEENPPVKPSPGEFILERWSPAKKKIVGIILAAFSGVMYAFQFIPARYIQQQYRDNGASQNSLDYVFAHYCGIYLTSTLYFIIYALFRRNQPKVFPRVIVPGIVSGLMWGVGTASWFIANKSLSDPVSFPIISTVPMGISLLIGIVAFKEIKGCRNISIVAVAMTLTIVGAVVAGLSKT
ncbi:transmembrane protein 144-like [Haliotis rufescens]|uniref:transmembrane protein 144-like n=1 Tax=Haliotis rufescens TaxID=6454 RepID=UPI00201F03E1|nr:transmembrane protein 144-like [Haliotis rufescens]XP_046369878.2 transmembrane protein 144-like [Haliotis rufescens]XP_046369879.2 transmembrane protein 144-like [Haliotis rufescens]XP_046369880.2 transmembrane protein 144-like [Haliotis rufescens]XP_046369881.2 transmembrane protein 144-like [Haliotis rufescens]XP_048243755.1 transmembrane protein 144-like [Haliotis rufescens]XP_048243756.1 transmembrane protein 144-like [Haliotis rufescens]